jgi:NADH-ubiquinone oxidoreductase chain 2
MVMLFTYLIVYIICNAQSSFNISEIGYYRITAIICLFCSVLTFNTYYINCLDSGLSIYGGLFHITNISQNLEIFLFLIASIILTAWPLNKINNLILKRNINNNFNLDLTKFNNYISNYSLIILFNLLGASLLISSYDLISLYLSIELQSFSLYVISTLYRNSEFSTSAGLKYFLLGGLSSCFILFGAALIYSYTGLTNFESIYILISSSNINNYILGFFLGLVFIFVGLLFKISAAPLHN